jgi:tetratricopeptide (TPR) repeat protein
MDSDLAQKAIAEALRGNWQNALKINIDILNQEPRDIDALNRSARAYAELGEIEKARDCAQKVLEIDPLNKIAAKSLIKWEGLFKTDGMIENHKVSISGSTFLEESGKTKIVSLVNLGDREVLTKLDCGEKVLLIPHNHSISVTTQNSRYIGKLPDDLAIRLINFIRSGNEYQAYIKGAEIQSVKIFIKETKRAENLKNIPSFPKTESYLIPSKKLFT